jgi:hypothetical protein
MLRRYLVGTLILPLFLLAAIGCGGSGGAEAPKVENPNVKARPPKLNSKAGDSGSSMKAE